MAKASDKETAGHRLDEKNKFKRMKGEGSKRKAEPKAAAKSDRTSSNSPNLSESSTKTSNALFNKKQ